MEELNQDKSTKFKTKKKMWDLSNQSKLSKKYIRNIIKIKF